MLASLKLIDLVEKNEQEIAKQWVQDVKKNNHTIHYHNLPEEKLMTQVVDFYHQLRKIMMSSNTYEQSQEYFLHYAKNSYAEGIPLHEAIYAIVLMRRHLWLFADFQTTFITVLEHQQAIDSITRTILVIDYAVHRITQYYQDMLNLKSKKK